MQGQTPVQLSESMGTFMNLPDIIQLFFYFIAVIYIIYSVILNYHWKEYGTNKSVTWITLATYGLTTVPLVLVLAALTFSF